MNVFRFAPLALVLGVSAAWGFGLNTIYGMQTIGKPFYAEIPLQAAPGVSESCTSLQAADGAAEFFMPDLKIAVAGPVNARRLVITSAAAVRNPMVSFLVRVQCGDASMSREYLLLADNAPAERSMARTPPPAATLAPTVAPSTIRNDGSEGGTPAVTDGTVLIPAPTTLNAMARALYPDDRAARDAYRAAFAAANPERFAGQDTIGSIPLPAGTRLSVPPGTPLPAVFRPARTTRAQSALPAADPARAQSLAKKAVAKKDAAKKGDQLTVGTANPQLQMLADAILRLEASSLDRDKISAELVGGVSGTLNSIIELKERINAQDAQVKQLITLQIEAERRHAREREDALGPLGLLALLFAAMMAGVGLLSLHHTLAARRTRPYLTDLWPQDQDESATPVSSPPAWAQTTSSVSPAPKPVPEPEQIPELNSGPRPEPKPEPDPEPEPEPGPAKSRPPPSPRRAPPAAIGRRTTPEKSELTDLLDLFVEQKAAVTTMIERLRATHSRDPDEWLNLVRQARAAGLMNSQEMSAIITEFKRLFNISLGHEFSDIGLETYPHVLRRIQRVWGGQEGLDFLNSLLFDDRDGGRNGFPETSFEELLMLRDVLGVRLNMFGEEGASPPSQPSLPSRSADASAEADMNVIEFDLALPRVSKE